MVEVINPKLIPVQPGANVYNVTFRSTEIKEKIEKRLNLIGRSLQEPGITVLIEPNQVVDIDVTKFSLQRPPLQQWLDWGSFLNGRYLLTGWLAKGYWHSSHDEEEPSVPGGLAEWD